MSKELWTIIIDAAVSVAIVAVGIWVTPDYQELAFTVVAALQAVAGALVVEFRGQRREAALQHRINSLLGR